MPGEKIWRVRRTRESAATTRQMIDSGAQNLTDNQVVEKFAEMATNLRNSMPIATGQAGHDSASSLASLLSSFARNVQNTPAGSSGTPAAHEPAVGSPSPSFLGGESSGFGGLSSMLGIAPAALPAPQEAPQADSSEAAGQPAKKRKKARGTSATHPPASSPAQQKTGEAPAVDKPAPKSGGKQGRPKRDLGKAVSEVVEEFQKVQVCGPTFAIWCGLEFKSNRRSIKRLADDIQTRIQDTQDEAELRSMTVHKKRLDSILAVCDFLAKNGSDHCELDEIIGTQNHYLALAPAASVTWPHHLEVKRLDNRLRKCDKPSDFWKACASAEQLLGVEGATKKQMSAIAERIISITKEEDTLDKLRLYFPVDIDLGSYDEAIAEQIEDIVCLINYEDTEMDKLEDKCTGIDEAWEHAKDAERSISAAMVVFPNGRAIVQEAHAFGAKGFATLEAATLILQAVADARAGLAASGHWACVAKLPAVSTAVGEAFSGFVLADHLHAKTDTVVQALANALLEHGLDGYCSLLAPLLKRTVEWQAWLKDSLSKTRENISQSRRPPLAWHTCLEKHPCTSIPLCRAVKFR